MAVEVKTTDTRSFQAPVPATREDTDALGRFLWEAAHDGYKLVGATELSGGSQRDPYTVGIRLKVARGD